MYVYSVADKRPFFVCVSGERSSFTDCPPVGMELRHHACCSVVLSTDEGCIPAKHLADQVSPLTLKVSLPMP